MVTKFVVGLGNCDPQLADTRHNVGFIVTDRLVSQLGEEGNWRLDHHLKASVSEANIGSGHDQGRLIFLKPNGYMNTSGEAVAKLAQGENLDPAKLLVIHDDLDLPLGEFRLQRGRGSAGHKGVQSIIDHLGGNDFFRLRVGIGRPPANVDPKDYVLGKFRPSEVELIQELADSRLGVEVQVWASKAHDF